MHFWNEPFILPPMARFAVILLGAMAVRTAALRLRLPESAGLMIFGAVIGPHVLGLVPHHAEVAHFFAEFGKLLLMFFVGLEIDLRQFAQARARAAAFGAATVALPLLGGALAGLAFGYPLVSAVLIGALLAPHTLIAFPLVSAAGLAGRPAVVVAAGATVLADMLALLVLAGCLATHRTGFDPWQLLFQAAQLVAFAALLLGVLGPLARHVSAWLGPGHPANLSLMFVVVCLAAVMAELIELEGIIGAFLAGLAVNEVAKDGEAAKQLELFGNQLFIPAFFIVTGFLIDVPQVYAALTGDIALVGAILLALVAGKWAAAEATGRAFGFSAPDRRLVASLTLPHVVATLAAALVAYEATNAAGQRLIDARILNATLVLVVATSIAGPILTARAIRQAAAPAPPDRGR